MNIYEVFILALASLIIGSISHPKLRSHLLLAASIVFVYWLQSRMSTIENINFWLPTAAIVLVTVSWVLTAPAEMKTLQKNWPGLAITLITIFAIDLTGYFWKGNLIFQNIAIPSTVAVFLALSGVLLMLLMALRASTLNQVVLPVFLVLLVVLFIVIKTPELNTYICATICRYTGSPPRQNSLVVWLGFSYFALRVIHIIRDRQNGLLLPVTFTEYLTYTFFFPSFAAGPIDRAERFVGDLNKADPRSSLDWSDAGSRFVLGLFKKFVIADGLAVFALNSETVMHVRSSGWFWILLYAYAFQIYFDFSGYTDIAIGSAKLMGINLPENFNSPYWKQNLTLFWNSWHMTLTQWFRSYFFFPLQRGIRASRSKMASWLLVLILQVSTMVLIGLWHEVALNFVLWGAWHGMGLFIHNRWKAYTGAAFSSWTATPFRKNILAACGIFLTFHYVAIGWIFFALPANQISTAIKMLLGVRS
jgi:alginate O-acetyltransferase complex protein AlgI